MQQVAIFIYSERQNASIKQRTVSVIGLGYVGLPVAVAFGLKRRTICFDINAQRIAELEKGQDCTGEVCAEELKAADILFTDSIEELRHADLSDSRLTYNLTKYINIKDGFYHV